MRRICLFDIDGTLTIPRNRINQEMKQTLRKLKKHMDIGLVGGSDQKKIREQIDEETIQLSNYFFSQNGLIAKKGKQIIGKRAIKDYLGEQKLKQFLKFCLRYIADLDIPIQRGTFIQYRTGLINVSPIGRNCSQQERDEYQKYDLQHGIRRKFIQELNKTFPEIGLKYSIGGQISFDAFPVGWDKTYCLQFLQQYDEIYFFGDKTYEGGNDYEIYQKLRPEGRSFSVKSPLQTIKILNQKFIL